MKVTIATITSYNSGAVEVTTRLFSDYNKAAKYLHDEYLDIKAEDNISYLFDDVDNITDEASKSFYLEDEKSEYWCDGNVEEREVE